MIKILKIWLFICIGCMAIYHLLPYSNTFTNILYYFSDHGLKIGLLLFIWKQYNSKEFLFVSFYFMLKLIYHLALLNKEYSIYLASIKSEIFAGILSLILLIYFIYEHEILQNDSKNNT